MISPISIHDGKIDHMSDVSEEDPDKCVGTKDTDVRIIIHDEFDTLLLGNSASTIFGILCRVVCGRDTARQPLHYPLPNLKF